jgi:hypothetical protein
MEASAEVASWRDKRFLLIFIHNWFAGPWYIGFVARFETAWWAQRLNGSHLKRRHGSTVYSTVVFFVLQQH